MLFRYKVKKSVDFPMNTWVTHYEITIQTYNAARSKWEKFKQEDLFYIVHKILKLDEDLSCNTWDNDYLNGCLYYINKYNGIDKVMIKYIKEILKEINHQDKKHAEENKTIMSLDKMLLSKDWKVIEVDEVKTDD